jgi:AcrR family transcriptional regulator
VAETSIRKPGRPTAEEAEDRVRHILATARRVFFDHGYGSASLEGIASAAGVAKTTIYRHFGSKKILFERCLSEATATLRIQLAEASEGPSVEEGLRYMACCLQDVIYQPENIELMRLLFAESSRFPELGRAYGTHARSVFITEMIEFLRRHSVAGGLALEDATMAAEEFHHLVMSARYFDVLMGIAASPDTKEREEIAEKAVRLFLSGYGPLSR